MKPTTAARLVIAGAVLAAPLLPTVAYAAPLDPPNPVVCTDIGFTPGGLIIRECTPGASTLDLDEDGQRDPQRYIVAPPSTLTPPVIPAYTPRPPAEPVTAGNDADDTAPLASVPAPAPVTREAPEPIVEQPVTDTTPNGYPMTVRADLAEPTPPAPPVVDTPVADEADPGPSLGDAVLYGVIALAALALLATTVIPLASKRNAARHAAD